MGFIDKVRETLGSAWGSVKSAIMEGLGLERIVEPLVESFPYMKERKAFDLVSKAKSKFGVWDAISEWPMKRELPEHLYLKTSEKGLGRYMHKVHVYGYSEKEGKMVTRHIPVETDRRLTPKEARALGKRLGRDFSPKFEPIGAYVEETYERRTIGGF